MSFIKFKACKGVFVLVGVRIWTSRVDESKVTMAGGPRVRFQNVYKLRRYRSSPCDCR
jgi:hypothetical protein